MTHKSRCMCGSVEVEISGDPAFVGYCHCSDCRAWLGAPLHGATLWPQDQVSITKGKGNVTVYKHTENSHRTSCKTCGGHVLNDHPGMGMTDVLAATIENYDWQPQMHIYYSEKMMSVPDGLPKFATLPEAFGGDGKTLPE